MKDSSLTTTNESRILTRADFHKLADVPPEVEWLANITNENTRRAYRVNVREFIEYVGIEKSEDFKLVTRAHVIAWRDHLKKLKDEHGKRINSDSTIRRKMSSLSSLCKYLCDNNAIKINPVAGSKRPPKPSRETPSLSDDKAKKLLNAPDSDTLKGKRDRAILSVLLYHALRREELVMLLVKDIVEIRGVKFFRVVGKGSKERMIPVHPISYTLIDDYLTESGHRLEPESPLFLPFQGKSGQVLNKHMRPQNVRDSIVVPYCKQAGIDPIGPHALRSTAATNALEHQADIAKVQKWLGHSDIATTRIYDKRKLRDEDSPTFTVSY